MRSSRISTHIPKDPKLERLLRDILAEVRASRAKSSPGVRVRRTAHGTRLDIARPKPGGAGAGVQQFQVFEEQYNYLICKEWAGDDNRTLDNPDVIVAKPYELRCFIQKPGLDGSAADVTITQWGHKLVVQLVAVHSNGFSSFLPNARLISFDGGGIASLQNSYYEFLDPPYFTTYTIPNPRPDGWNEDLRGKLLFAFQSGNGVGPVWDFRPGNQSVDIGPAVKWIELPGQRKWRKELQVCDGGVARYMRIDSSEVYGGTIVPP